MTAEQVIVCSDPGRPICSQHRPDVCASQSFHDTRRHCGHAGSARETHSGFPVRHGRFLSLAVRATRLFSASASRRRYSPNSLRAK